MSKKEEKSVLDHRSQETLYSSCEESSPRVHPSYGSALKQQGTNGGESKASICAMGHTSVEGGPFQFISVPGLFSESAVMLGSCVELFVGCRTVIARPTVV